MEIRTVTRQDVRQISELAIRSKSHWDYTPDQMTVFRNELTMTPNQLDSRIAFAIEHGSGLLGFYTIVKCDDGAAELEHLFIDPEHLRCGLGTQLLRHATAHSRSHGIQKIVVASDPNAAGFYEHHGARLIKQIPSSIPGRTIPQFQIDPSDPECGL